MIILVYCLLLATVDGRQKFYVYKQTLRNCYEERSDTEYSQFVSFIRQYGKVYNTSTECKSHFETFKLSMSEAERYQDESKGSAVYGITKFSDLSLKEFSDKHLGHTPTNGSSRKLKVGNAKLPERFDWREREVLNDVPDQKACNASYAFASIANLEGIHAVKYHQLYQLSQQQILDCDHVNRGCSGGSLTEAMKYISNNGSIPLYDYHYTGIQNKCSYNETQLLIRPSKYKRVAEREEKIARALMQVGPLAAVVDAKYLKYYISGVINSAKCRSDYKQAVVLVGFGVETMNNGKHLPYWLVRNSWGTNWGEEGYFRIARDKQMCGINKEVFTFVYRRGFL